MHRRFVSGIIIVGFAVASWGQEAWDIAKTTIGGKRVSIEYGRPNLHGRSLADLMKQLPDDRMWRAGSGPVTIFSTEADLLMGGKKIPAGNYALYMYCPESGDYALALNSDLGAPFDGPLPKADPGRANRPYPHYADYTFAIGSTEVARVPLKKMSMPKSEVLMYGFEVSGKGVVLTIRWGEQAWTVDVRPAG